ncbi:hypothetical protein ALO45_200015 [Pseudomonas syringae pv. syringae]|nr:hypothetical protein ALO45_200015 [Pseudomonas syringae pv. syringae]
MRWWPDESWPFKTITLISLFTKLAPINRISLSSGRQLSDRPFVNVPPSRYARGNVQPASVTLAQKIADGSAIAVFIGAGAYRRKVTFLFGDALKGCVRASIPSTGDTSDTFPLEQETGPVDRLS